MQTELQVTLKSLQLEQDTLIKEALFKTKNLKLEQDFFYKKVHFIDKELAQFKEIIQLKNLALKQTKVILETEIARTLCYIQC
jgi:hypothetical protein